MTFGAAASRSSSTSGRRGGASAPSRSSRAPHRHDRDDEHYYAIDGLGRRASRSRGARRPSPQDAKGGRPLDEQIERDREAGRREDRARRARRPEVDHYRLTQGDGDRTTVWVTTDESRLPVESSLPIADRRGEPPRLPALRSRRRFPTISSSPTRDVKLESMTYDEYVARSKKGPVGPGAAVLLGPAPRHARPRGAPALTAGSSPR